MGQCFPTCFLPLLIFIKDNPRISLTPPSDDKLLKIIDFLTRKNINSKRNKDISFIELFPDKTLIEKKFDQFISNLKIIKGRRNAFIYFIGEIIDNIYEHSMFSIAYIMAREEKNKNFTELAFIDNGISIPGSYEQEGFHFSNIEALQQALKGLSTKNDERGYGLRTSLNLLIKGFDAECLLISRRAVLIGHKNDRTFFNLQKNNIFSRTLLSTRIPHNNKEVNVYDYIE